MDLKQRILKASEFDEAVTAFKYKTDDMANFFDEETFIQATRKENSRLRPLIEALASAVETLENINSVTKKQFEEHPMYWATMANGASGEALADLEQVVGGEG